MKKTLAAAAVLLASTVAGSAADLAVKAPIYAPAPVWTWTGFYIGAHAGAGWGTTEATLTSVSGLGQTALFSLPFAQVSRSGFLGGGQVGYNWQSGWAVFGVQGDIAGMDVKGTAPCVILFSCTAKSDWLATVTGRIGGVVADRGLVYVKGGGAWMNTTYSVGVPTFGGLGGGVGGLGVNGTLTSASSTNWGWLLGLGVEYMFTQNWTGFIEYDYMDFDVKNDGFPINALRRNITVNADLKDKLSIAKVGVNYKF